MTEEELLRKLGENFVAYSKAWGNKTEQRRLIDEASDLLRNLPPKMNKLMMERFQNAELRNRGKTGPIGDGNDEEFAVKFVMKELGG